MRHIEPWWDARFIDDKLRQPQGPRQPFDEQTRARLDQFVKHSLKVRPYLHYVDDFVLLGDNTATPQPPAPGD